MHKSIKPGTKSRTAWFGAVMAAIMLMLSGCGPGVVLPKNESEVPRITPADLKARLDRGEEVLIVDTRSAGEYSSRHIADAISVPEEELASRLDEFPRDQAIVFY